PGLVAPRVAAVLGVRGTAGEPLINAMANVLKYRKLLLVLDNCEHSLAGRSSSPLHGCHYSASKARLEPPPCARTWAAPEALRFPRHWPHLLDRGSVTHQHWYGRGAGSFFQAKTWVFLFLRRKGQRMGVPTATRGHPARWVRTQGRRGCPTAFSRN